MSFSENFSVAQTPLNPALVIVEDTSTGADVLIVSRKITFTDAGGNTVVPSGTSTTYVAWPLATNPITVNLLTTDMALSIQVDWLDAGGVALYTKTTSYALVEYNKAFLYYLIQQQSLTPSIVQDQNYSINLANFWTTIIGATNAIEIGNDLSAAQNVINIGTNYRLNENFYF